MKEKPPVTDVLSDYYSCISLFSSLIVWFVNVQMIVRNVTPATNNYLGDQLIC